MNTSICVHYLKKVLALFLVVTMVVMPLQPQAWAQLAVTAPTTITPHINSFNPVMIKGLALDQHNPLRFNFIVNAGDTDLDDDALIAETHKLAKYFFASLTVPDEDLWVNLSPYEDDRIIAEALGQTDLGKDLLEQDYFLKQFTSSLLHPDHEQGKRFWARVYQEAQKRFGTTAIPVETFHKVWIVPEKAVVMERGEGAFVVERKLKVMLEHDYVAEKKAQRQIKRHSEERSDEESQRSFANAQDDKVFAQDDKDDLSSEIMREIIIPAIEDEVNHGASFATLRQVYNAMILAQWYKKTLKDSLLGKVYANQNKVSGIDLADKDVKNKIYHDYVEGYKKGVFDFIREDVDPVSKETLPRHYFSGGMSMIDVTTTRVPANQRIPRAYQQEIERQSDRNMIAVVEGVENTNEHAMVSSTNRVDHNNRSRGITSTLKNLTFSILCAGAVSCGGPSNEDAQQEADQTNPAPITQTQQTQQPSNRTTSSTLAYNDRIFGAVREVSQTYQERFETVVSNDDGVFWSYDMGAEYRLNWSVDNTGPIDLSDVVDDGVFRLIARGHQPGHHFQIIFTDDKNRQVIFNTGDDVMMTERLQRISVELKDLKEQNSSFNWSKVNAPVLRVKHNMASQLSIERWDVINAPHREIGVGLFTNNDFRFEALSPGNNTAPASVLSFTNLDTDPQQTLSQWNQLKRAGKIPHEVFEFARGDDPSGYNPQLLNDIADGRYDQELRLKAQAAQQFGDLILLRTLHEALGGWYPWSIETLADADNYIRAWKHIYQIYQQEGATNVAFGYSPHEYNPASLPQTQAYQITEYIVRALQNEIHFIGIDAYSRSENNYTSLNNLITGLLEVLGKYRIPFILGEMSYGEPVSEADAQREQEFWSTTIDAFKKGKFPEVVALTVFSTQKNENGKFMDFVPPAQIKQTLVSDSFFRFDGDWADVLRAKSGVADVNIPSPFVGHRMAQPAVTPSTTRTVEPAQAASTSEQAYQPTWRYDENNKQTLTPEAGITRWSWRGKTPNEWFGSGVEPGGDIVFQSLRMPVKDIAPGTVFNIVLEDATNPNGNGQELRFPSNRLNNYIENGVLILRRSQIDQGQAFDWNRFKQLKMEPVSTNGSVLLGQPVFNEDEGMAAKNMNPWLKTALGVLAIGSVLWLAQQSFFNSLDLEQTPELGDPRIAHLSEEEQKQLIEAWDATHEVMKNDLIEKTFSPTVLDVLTLLTWYDPQKSSQYNGIVKAYFNGDPDAVFLEFLYRNNDLLGATGLARSIYTHENLTPAMLQKMVDDNNIMLFFNPTLTDDHIQQLFDQREPKSWAGLSASDRLSGAQYEILYEEMMEEINEGEPVFPMAVDGFVPFASAETTHKDFVVRSLARNPAIPQALRERMVREYPALIDELVSNPATTLAELARYGQERSLPLMRTIMMMIGIAASSEEMTEETKLYISAVTFASAYSNVQPNMLDPLRSFIVRASNRAYEDGNQATAADIQRLENAQELFNQWLANPRELALEATGDISADITALIERVTEQLEDNNMSASMNKDSGMSSSEKRKKLGSGAVLLTLLGIISFFSFKQKQVFDNLDLQQAPRADEIHSDEKVQSWKGLNTIRKRLGMSNAIHTHSGTLYALYSMARGDYDAVRKEFEDEFNRVLSYLQQAEVDTDFMNYVEPYLIDLFIFFRIGHDDVTLEPRLTDEVFQRLVMDVEVETVSDKDKFLRYHLNQAFDNRTPLTMPGLTSVFIAFDGDQYERMYTELTASIEEGDQDYPVATSTGESIKYTTFSDYVIRFLARHPYLPRTLREQMASEHPHLIEELISNPGITYAEVVSLAQNKTLPVIREYVSQQDGDRREITMAEAFNNPYHTDPIKQFLIEANNNVLTQVGQQATADDIKRLQDAQLLFERWLENPQDIKMPLTGNMGDDITALIERVTEQLEDNNMSTSTNADEGMTVKGNNVWRQRVMVTVLALGAAAWVAYEALILSLDLRQPPEIDYSEDDVAEQLEVAEAYEKINTLKIYKSLRRFGVLPLKVLRKLKLYDIPDTTIITDELAQYVESQSELDPGLLEYLYYSRDDLMYYRDELILNGYANFPAHLIQDMVDKNDVYIFITPDKISDEQLQELFVKRNETTKIPLAAMDRLNPDQYVTLYEELESRLDEGNDMFPVAVSGSAIAGEVYTTFNDFILRSLARNPAIPRSLRDRMAEEHPHLVEELLSNANITLSEIVAYGQTRSLPEERVYVPHPLIRRVFLFDNKALSDRDMKKFSNDDIWRIINTERYKSSYPEIGDKKNSPFKIFLIEASNKAFNEGGQQATAEDIQRLEDAQLLFERWLENPQDIKMPLTGNMSDDITALIELIKEQLNDQGVVTYDTFNPGGIDLNPAAMDLQIKRDDRGIPLSLDQQPLDTMNIEGLFPVIINITPISLPLVLSELIDKEQQQGDMGDPYRNADNIVPYPGNKEDEYIIPDVAA